MRVDRINTRGSVEARRMAIRVRVQVHFHIIRIHLRIHIHIHGIPYPYPYSRPSSQQAIHLSSQIANTVAATAAAATAIPAVPASNAAVPRSPVHLFTCSLTSSIINRLHLLSNHFPFNHLILSFSPSSPSPSPPQRCAAPHCAALQFTRRPLLPCPHCGLPLLLLLLLPLLPSPDPPPPSPPLLLLLFSNTATACVHVRTYVRLTTFSLQPAQTGRGECVNYSYIYLQYSTCKLKAT